jgi:hypothetical protein
MFGGFIGCVYVEAARFYARLVGDDANWFAVDTGKESEEVSCSELLHF